MRKDIELKNPMAVSIPQAAKLVDLSETYFRQLVYRREIPAIKIGRRWIIPVKALEAWLNGQIQE